MDKFNDENVLITIKIIKERKEQFTSKSMEIHIINPIGFCFGVTRAIDIASKLDKSKKITFLGMVVHNEEVISSFSSANINIIDERKHDLKEALLQVEDGTIVVFSAHGHPKEYEEIARKKNLIQIDTTCPLVALNLKLGLDYASEGLIYIGSKNHLEASSFRLNCPASYFFDISSYSYLAKPEIDIKHVISQTTLSTSEVDKAIKIIQKDYPNAKLERSVCDATKARQVALSNLEDDYDAIIVIGSSSSSNTNKLFSIAKNKNKNSFLMLNSNELKQIKDLPKYKKIALCSGTSASMKTIDECLEYLRSL